MRVVPRTSPLRCAYCHGDLEPGAWRCERCGTLTHADCRDELARCPTLGCRPVLRIAGVSLAPIAEPVARGCSMTLIEWLVVLGIFIGLCSLLVPALFPRHGRRPTVKKTQALIEKVKTALDQYYSEFHDYPPDGYDNEPGWTVDPSDTPGPLGGGVLIRCASGKRLSFRGSGCLIYFLCYPVANWQPGMDAPVTEPGHHRPWPPNRGAPFLTTLKREEFSVHHWDQDFDPVPVPGSTGYKDEWCRGEIVDCFMFPIHYDKVRKFDATRFVGARGVAAHPDTVFCDRYVTQLVQAFDGQLPNAEDVCAETGRPHNPPGVTHADPRSPQKSDGCYVDEPARARNLEGVDIWSHGGTWANGINSITNWK